MIAVHQSQFIPWVPYLFKILKSDIFVVLDDVQYQKNGLQNRNQIKTPQGPHWLTIPVKMKLGDKINEVKVTNGKSIDNILKTIEHNYKKSPFFNDAYPLVESVLHKHNKLLIDINNELLMGMLDLIGVSSKIRYSSHIKTTRTKDDLVIEIIKYFGEKEYLSGRGALDYMDLNKFKKEGVRVFTYDYEYVEYPQQWNRQQGFISNLSILDLVFNNLNKTSGYIHDNGIVKPLE